MVCDQHENGPLKLFYVTIVSVPNFFLVPIILLALLTAANHHILSQVFYLLSPVCKVAVT